MNTTPPSPHRPPACLACGSTAMGTLAKSITADTVWRCQRCGEVWKAPKPPRR